MPSQGPNYATAVLHPQDLHVRPRDSKFDVCSLESPLIKTYSMISSLFRISQEILLQLTSVDDGVLHASK